MSELRKKMPVYHTYRKYQRDGLWADNITFPWPDQYKELQINILGCLLVKIIDSIHKLKQSFLSDFEVKLLSLNLFSYWLENILPGRLELVLNCHWTWTC